MNVGALTAISALRLALFVLAFDIGAVAVGSLPPRIELHYLHPS